MSYLLIDAMNVIGARPTGWWRDRSGATRHFADELSVWASSAAVGEWEGVTLVIDGCPLLGMVGDGTSIEVVYAPGGRNSADDRIVELVEGYRNSTALVVVTSDRGLRCRLERLGATVRGARWLLGELEC
jgi:predicted RNA-binding protein with PIN domain